MSANHIKTSNPILSFTVASSIFTEVKKPLDTQPIAPSVQIWPELKRTISNELLYQSSIYQT